jgi:5-methylcytosine-specific restriction endonuclease McrA
MQSYSLAHLSDQALLRDLAALVAQDRCTTAAMLAHLAEVDARRLYLPAAYPSMYAWCTGELRLSEDAAFRRIRAARTAREFPTIFAALADGRLNLSTLLLLAPHLTSGNADGLLAAAAHKTRTEIELLLAERFPQPDLPTVVRAVATREASSQRAPAPVAGRVEAPCAPPAVGHTHPSTVRPPCADSLQLAPAPLCISTAQPARPATAPPEPRAKLAPLSPQRFALQVTVTQGTHDKLRYAQALLGHAVAPGDVAQVLDRALDALIAKLEQRRFAVTSRSVPRRSQGKGRYVPAEVRREVWRRDGGQCSFVGPGGRRCPARTRLEFDHVTPVAHGGRSTVEGLRLRCRAHNQHDAERVFGRAFVQGRQEQARRRAIETRMRASAAATSAGRLDPAGVAGRSGRCGGGASPGVTPGHA